MMPVHELSLPACLPADLFCYFFVIAYFGVLVVGALFLATLRSCTTNLLQAQALQQTVPVEWRVSKQASMRQLPRRDQGISRQLFLHSTLECGALRNGGQQPSTSWR